MFINTLFKKIHKKLLRILLRKNAFTLVDKINSNGYWYYIHKYAHESMYKELLINWFYDKTGNILNLDNPRTFNEKIQWLKLFDTTPLKSTLSDKYLVRQWITEKIGEKYLVPLYGVWDSFDEIDFDKLPNQFVLKVNHGSQWLIIVKNKNKLNKSSAKKKFNLWINTNFAYREGLELQYRDITPKIIAEKYLEDKSGGLADYKFYCFDGKPCFIEYYLNNFKKDGYKTIMFDLNWERTGWTVDANHELKTTIKKPENFDEMIKIASILCKDFYHVRVDLRVVNDKIYFGEMTFTSASGLEHFEPEEWNLKLGNMIKLPIDK